MVLFLFTDEYISNVFTYPSVEGHLSSLYFLAIMSVISIDVHVRDIEFKYIVNEDDNE